MDSAGQEIPERRKSANAMLRKLVDAFKGFTQARDDLWALGFFDRIARKKKCKDVYDSHEKALIALRNAIQEMSRDIGIREALATKGGLRPDEGVTSSEEFFKPPVEPLISPEEFEALLNPQGIPGFGKSRGSRRRRA
jgi:hypothetical protein